MQPKAMIFGLGALTCGALLTTSVLASSGAKQAPTGLQPVAPPSAPHRLAPVQLTAPGAPATSWREALSSEDFEQRATAFDQAVEAARRDATLRTALGEWAEDKSLGELAWTAHLILHEVNKQPAHSFGFGAQDPFQGLFGDRDPFQDFFGGGDPFAGLFPRGLGSAPLPQQLPSSSGGMQMQGRSFSMETTPDGVKVRVETEGPDGTQTQEFEADSLEDLQATHPELFEDQGLQVFSGQAPGGLFGHAQGLVPAPMLPAGKVRTDVLGVMVREVAESSAGPGGLLVERVLPGTIAAAVGLEKGDVVLRVAGMPVATSADVKAALRDRDDDEGVVVEWRDAAGDVQAGSWEPEL